MRNTVQYIPLKPLPKLGTAADPFRFMDAHCWDFTKQSSLFQYQKDQIMASNYVIFQKNQNTLLDVEIQVL